MENKSITFLVAYVDRLWWFPKEYMIASTCLEDVVKLFLQRIQKRGIEPSRVLAVEMFEYDGSNSGPSHFLLGFMQDDGSMIIEDAPAEYSGQPFDVRHLSLTELVKMKLKKYIE